MSSVRATSLSARSSKRPALHQRGRVFRYLILRGYVGATLEELEGALGLPGNTVRPRRLELEEKGFVIDSGRRRFTKAGREAIVWIVPERIRLVVSRRLTKMALNELDAQTEKEETA